MTDHYSKIESFAEVDFFKFREQFKEKIKSEIESKSKEYILGIDEHEYKSYLIQEYTLVPLRIDSESETYGEPNITKETTLSRPYGTNIQSEVYIFTIFYSFSGSPELFRIRPTTWRMDSAEININYTKSTVSFSFKLYQKNPNAFMDAKSSIYSSAFTNLDNINNDINGLNNEVPGIINSTFNNQKRKYLLENDFFAAIKIKVNNDTRSVFTPPTIKKQIIPRPQVPNKKEFYSEPTMSVDMYNDILKIVYDSGKSMERKPALYIGKDEEGLRDQFLFVLETRYVGTTATGETFNRSGKTDIMLKYADDGSNLFVAECKFWRGSSEFLKAITQLFERYLTWRDSKVALILFVTNLDFSDVLMTIKKDIKNHPNFIKEIGTRGESSFSFLMSLPQDHQKQIFLEVIAFHYDKK
jgi:hypothetical protein